MDTVDIVPVDPADEDLLADLHRLHHAVHAADRPDHPRPLWKPFLARVRQDNREVRTELLAARVDGQLVGRAMIGWPIIDNRHLAQFDLEVIPAHRRRGVGRAMLAQVRHRAQQEQRRTLITGANRPVPGGPPRSEAGARFLAAMGFSVALASMWRRVDLTAVDLADEQRLLADCLPRAAGYELLTWTGPTPEPLAGGVAQLVNRLMTDAPTGELEIEDSTLDAPRLHADEQASMDRGTHLVGVVARHRETGEVAAHTRFDVRPPGDHGTIWVTIADPRHRGHRLGTIVKIEAHRLVRETFPGLQHIYTGNADENAHMVAINERLGYRPVEAAILYQLNQ